MRLAVTGRVPVDFYGRWGGVTPSVEELRKAIFEAYEEGGTS